MSPIEGPSCSNCAGLSPSVLYRQDEHHSPLCALQYLSGCLASFSCKKSFFMQESTETVFVGLIPTSYCSFCFPAGIPVASWIFTFITDTCEEAKSSLRLFSPRHATRQARACSGGNTPNFIAAAMQVNCCSQSAATPQEDKG